MHVERLYESRHPRAVIPLSLSLSLSLSLQHTPFVMKRSLAEYAPSEILIPFLGDKE